MKKQAYNPYLPFWETVPDGEPHVFGDRIYIYGSHDTLNGTTFCSGDYVSWSAPVNDLCNWQYEGVSYRAIQDPFNGAPNPGGHTLPANVPALNHPHYLFAPDCCKGKDGRYYLYYALDFVGVVSVAVSDQPQGPFTFLNYVTREDGTVPEIGIWFDPAVLCEEDGVYLYYGFAPDVRFPGQEEKDIPGGMAVRLADDMHTILSEPVLIANGCDTAKGTDFENHPFYEASSIRHIDGRYYFVYSSLQGHELCYAVSLNPLGPFTYKGVIISNADLGYKENQLPVNYWGNNHGGLVQANGKTWIFYHRQTHGNEYSRQGCAEKVHIAKDGMIEQVEMTSCGLNDGPLRAKGRYLSYIACNVMAKDRTKMGHVISSGPDEPVPPNPPEMPYITEEKGDIEQGLKPYIANMSIGTCAGFKYFYFDGSEEKISIEIRGTGVFDLHVDSPNGEMIASVQADSKDWQEYETKLHVPAGTHALFFQTKEGKLDFAAFTIH